MKKILISTSIIFLAIIVGYIILSRKQEIKNTPIKNKTIVVFGDSLAEGAGATSGNDLASLLSKKININVVNHGKSGDTTKDALNRTSDVVSENPGIVIIILGGNDFLKKIPNKETFDNLEKIILNFQDSGSAVILFGVRSGLVGDSRGDEYSKLAKKTNSLYLSDILSGLFGDSRYMSDAIHPNDAGYAIIEERLRPLILKMLSIE